MNQLMRPTAGGNQQHRRIHRARLRAQHAVLAHLPRRPQRDPGVCDYRGVAPAEPRREITFVKGDRSLLSGVDEVCRVIQEKEERVNLLFMSQGNAAMKQNGILLLSFILFRIYFMSCMTD